MHRVLRAAEFAWGPKAAYEVTFLGCTSRFVRMNQYDVETCNYWSKAHGERVLCIEPLFLLLIVNTSWHWKASCVTGFFLCEWPMDYATIMIMLCHCNCCNLWKFFLLTMQAMIPKCFRGTSIDWLNVLLYNIRPETDMLLFLQVLW